MGCYLLYFIFTALAMKKEHKKRYPDNWDFISAFIRLERARNKCERCGINNGLHIIRMKYGKWREANTEEMQALTEWKEVTKDTHHRACKKLGITKIILTVAHLNHNEKDNSHSNLLALCQRCHLMHDRQDNQWRASTKGISPKQIRIF